MKKLIVLLSIVLLLVTGCSIKKLDSSDFRSNNLKRDYKKHIAA